MGKYGLFAEGCDALEGLVMQQHGFGGRLLLIHLQVFEELVKLIGVLVCSFAWDCAFDDGVAVTDQVVAEITILVVLASGEELVCWVCGWDVLDDRRWKRGFGGRGRANGSGRHQSPGAVSQGKTFVGAFHFDHVRREPI